MSNRKTAFILRKTNVPGQNKQILPSDDRLNLGNLNWPRSAIVCRRNGALLHKSREGFIL